MFLRRISLRGFRNYDQLDLSFSKGLNIFVGENAQGKTNLLESIYLLALGRSFRTLKDDDLIGWKASEARIRAEVDRLAGAISVYLGLPKTGSKHVRIGGERLRRLADLLGHVNVVVFSPDDLQVLKGSPSERRRFLDAEIAQVSSVYRYHFLRYQRVLRQRNNLLKAIRGGQASPGALDPWDAQLITEGVPVLAKRAETVRRIGRWAAELYTQLAAGRERLTIHYRPFFVGDDDVPLDDWENHDYLKESFARALEVRREDEIGRGITLAGPQRDDVVFRVDGADMRSFASQGQQRSAILAAKLAELEFFREEVGEYPILLLDDVMSELDDRRREHFLGIVSGRVNTFITTTNLRSFKQDILDIAAIFHIEAGTVKKTDEDGSSGA